MICFGSVEIEVKLRQWRLINRTIEKSRKCFRKDVALLKRTLLFGVSDQGIVFVFGAVANDVTVIGIGIVVDVDIAILVPIGTVADVSVDIIVIIIIAVTVAASFVVIVTEVVPDDDAVVVAIDGIG